MTAWASGDLSGIGATGKPQVAAARRHGRLGNPAADHVVRHGDDLDIRPASWRALHMDSNDSGPDWTGFDLSRRELLQLTAAGGGALVAGRLGPEAVPPAAAQPAEAATPLAEAAAAPVDVVLRVNGTEHQLTLDPRTTLLDALREHLQLTGSKQGCGLGQCGACTVLMDGQRMKSCLWLAALVDGREIETIEGLAQGEELHPLQVAFIERDAFQCGYCTPGQIMAGVACIAEGHAGSPEEIRAWMSGNICRCGAYDPIVAAIGDAARAMGSVQGG